MRPISCCCCCCVAVNTNKFQQKKIINWNSKEMKKFTEIKKKHFYISGTYEKNLLFSPAIIIIDTKINLINQSIEPKIDHHHHHCESQIIPIIQNCCCCFDFSDFDVQLFFTSWFIHNTDDDDDVFSLFFLMMMAFY